ncbi:alpha/beta fold hydrolase [Streptomyces sp. NPDC005438]|uniref:thioesterase II family protein n=1 Tax=Streptomyces sp. NPDC005438 TaxID=3156880 RepID=UPI0033A1AB38
MTDSRTTTPWIRRFATADPSAPVLVCLPHAGGSASAYRNMARSLAPGVEVWAAQYPGRQDRMGEPVVEDVRELARLVLAELGPARGRPTAVFGHSMGALVGYELAREMLRSGWTPTRLFASGRRAPSRYRDEAPAHLLDDDALLRRVMELNGTDEQLWEQRELLRLVLPAIRGDYRAVETYRHRPEPPMGVPVTVLTGDVDPRVTEEEARAWAEHTGADFECRVLPGGHFYLYDHEAEVCRVVRERLVPSGAAR